MIGSGRDKIESQQDLETAASVAKQLELDGIVVVGGDDSNTNAAVLAEFFLSQGACSAHTYPRHAVSTILCLMHYVACLTFHSPFKAILANKRACRCLSVVQGLRHGCFMCARSGDSSDWRAQDNRWGSQESGCGSELRL